MMMMMMHIADTKNYMLCLFATQAGSASK